MEKTPEIKSFEKKYGVKIVAGISECDEECVYYPPSSLDGKPCSHCEPTNLFLNCKRTKGD